MQARTIVAAQIIQKFRICLEVLMSYLFLRLKLCLPTTKKAFGVPRSPTITWYNRPNISVIENEWRMNNFLRRSQRARATVSPAFHTDTGERLQNSKTSAAKKRQSGQL